MKGYIGHRSDQAAQALAALEATSVRHQSHGQPLYNWECDDLTMQLEVDAKPALHGLTNIYDALNRLRSTVLSIDIQRDSMGVTHVYLNGPRARARADKL